MFVDTYKFDRRRLHSIQDKCRCTHWLRHCLSYIDHRSCMAAICTLRCMSSKNNIFNYDMQYVCMSMCMCVCIKIFCASMNETRKLCVAYMKSLHMDALHNVYNQLALLTVPIDSVSRVRYSFVVSIKLAEHPVVSDWIDWTVAVCMLQSFRLYNKYSTGNTILLTDTRITM